MELVLFGKALEVDFLDYDFSIKCEKEYEKVLDSVKDITDRAEHMKQSEFIKESCEVVNNFFDSLFGEGTSKEIFKGKMNYGMSLTALGEFTQAKNNSGTEIKKITETYAPGKPDKMNREQRRQNQKHKGKNKNNHIKPFPNNNNR